MDRLTVFIKLAAIKSCSNCLQICISKRFSKIHISSKFEPISSKNDRVAKIIAFYEVSLVKIPRNCELPQIEKKSTQLVKLSEIKI